MSVHSATEVGALLLCGIVAAIAAINLVKAVLQALRQATIAAVLKPIPCAPGWQPLVGHTLALLQAPSAWDAMNAWALKSLSTTPERQPLVRASILGRQCVLTADPGALRRVLQTGVKRYVKDVDFAYKAFLPLLGTGLVTSEGKLWSSQRTAMSNTLRFDILPTIGRIACAAALRFQRHLSQFVATGEPVAMCEEFRRLTLQVIVEALLSLPPEESDAVFPSLYVPIMEEGNRRAIRPWRTYLPSFAMLSFWNNTWQLDKYINALLDRRWKEYKQRLSKGDAAQPRMPFDVLEHMLQVAAGRGVHWDSKTRKQMAYEMKTFVLAGHETSAAMLTWAMWELSQNPHCLTRLQEEARKVFDGKSLDDPDDVEAIVNAAHKGGCLDYSYAVLRETLRRHTVVPTVVRACAQDDELCGYAIPKDTTIVLALEATHMAPHIWPEPNEFRPERFLGDAFEGVDRFSYMPFIEGPRNCLGQYLALLEGRIVLSKLCHSLKFTPVSPTENQRASDVIPVAPKYGMRMTIEARS